MIKNDLLVGVAGEHLVCCDLICKGYNAFMTDQGLPYDLILDVDDKLLRVQVKTTRTHTELPQRQTRYPSYLFHVRRCGKGGKTSYNDVDVDLFALVCLETKQVGYLAHSAMPMTLSVRVDSFKGNYLNELQETRALEVFKLKESGMINADIGRTIGMDKSVVTKVLAGKSKKKEQGIYFSDLTLEKALDIVVPNRTRQTLL